MDFQYCHGSDDDAGGNLRRQRFIDRTGKGATQFPQSAHARRGVCLFHWRHGDYCRHAHERYFFGFRPAKYGRRSYLLAVVCFWAAFCRRVVIALLVVTDPPFPNGKGHSRQGLPRGVARRIKSPGATLAPRTAPGVGIRNGHHRLDQRVVVLVCTRAQLQRYRGGHIGRTDAFFLPSSNARRDLPLLDWDNAQKIQWGVLLFFGGGLALAKGFDHSGLAKWMGAQMESLDTLPMVLILLVVLSMVTLLSELASNIATASMMMPVLAVLAKAVGADPFGFLLSAAVAASFGFGLPVATAPNTIVFSSGHLHTRDMARAGFLLDAIAILLLLAFIYFFLPLVWGIQM